MISARFVIILLFVAVATAQAADQPFGVLDIELGASYGRLERELDFRDINRALAQIKSGKPDFGKRGYGCMKRNDPLADVACVSHEEKIGGVETREIRLHFLAGRLQQFSLTAEIRHYETVTSYLSRRYGEPQQVAAAGPDAAPSLKWQSESGQVAAFRGKDLVFVSFELVSYAGAVKRKREGTTLECS